MAPKTTIFATFAIILLGYNVGGAEIDWSRMTGFWYISIGTNIPWSDIPACQLMSPFNYSDHGFSLLIHTVGTPGKPGKTVVHVFDNVDEGVYQPRMPDEIPDLDTEMSLSKGASTEELDNIMKQFVSFFENPVTITTDYMTYMTVEQSLSDAELFWVVTRVPNPSPSEFKRLSEMVASMQPDVKLHEFRCATTMPQDYIMT